LNGSPKVGNTAAMVNAFAEGAKEAGHEVEILHVGKMKINGCLACEYCHTKGEGKCVQKDDMEKVMPAYKEADMVVFASPIDFAEIKLYLQFNDKLVLRRYSRRKKRGPQVRKGKAMLQINTNSLKITNCLFDLQRTIMPDADDAEWLSCVCL
jgi:multimeric flavodoxin WrbA